LKELDPSRPFWPSSPSNGVDVWDNPQDLTRGDSHYWGVWHGQKPFTEYLTITPRFSSEFGFQSIPSLQTLKPFLSKDGEDYNLTSGAMEFRQRSFRVGNKAILEHISRHFRVPTGFQETIYVSQVLQALSIKTACEHWRRQKEICSGAMYWQLNDIWPGTSWSSIEWNSRWKLLQYFSAKFFAPLLISLVENKEKQTIEIWITSDIHTTIEGTVSVQLVSYDDGETVKEWTVHSTSISSFGSRKVISIYLRELFGEDVPAFYPYSSGRSNALYNKTEQFMVCQFRSDDGRYTSENYHYFCPLKFVNLKKPKFTITHHPEQNKFTIESDQVSLFVGLHEPCNDTVDTATVIRFSDNGFILLPFKPKTISYTTTQFSYDKSPNQLQAVNTSSLQQLEDISIVSLRDAY
jgi:hypothetical protein